MERCADCHSDYLVKKAASLCDAVTKINDEKLPSAHQRIDDLAKGTVSMRLFMWVFGFAFACLGVLAGMSISTSRDMAVAASRLEQIEKGQIEKFGEIKILIERLHGGR